MASRRLNSDRFFTADYTPQAYTQVGLDWIDDNGMATVLLRHMPRLAPALRNVENPFYVWDQAGSLKSPSRSPGPRCPGSGQD